MKVLVTGGAGFLGSHLTEALLAAGHDVAVLARTFEGRCLPKKRFEEIERIEADVRDVEALRSAAHGCQRIFHCAAMVGADVYARYPVETMEMEVEALKGVCSVALSENVEKVIFPSTSAVYGNVGLDGALVEDGPLAPTSPYAVAKRYNELYLEAQHRENGLQSVSLRIFNIYGPRQDERLVIPRFMKMAMKGEALTVFGDGSHTRDFVFVDDVVKAALLCADKVEGCEIVNAALGQDVSVREMAEGIVAATGSSASIAFQPAPEARSPFEVDRCVGSTAKLERVTGFKPKTTLSEGLAKVRDCL